jgi:hypothetical protein
MLTQLSKLIAPACVLAGLTSSSTALAGEDPASERADGVELVEQVESSEPVTLEHVVVPDGDDADGRILHGGRFALGASRTLAGLTGITARFFLTDHFHLGVNVGVATFSYRQPDVVNDAVDCSMDQTAGACTKKMRTIAYIGSSLEGIYWILGRPAGNLPFQANFGLGGRVGFQHIVNDTDIGRNLDDPLQITVEVPLVVALNFGTNFSIQPEFGAAFRINPGTRLANNIAVPPDLGDTNPGFQGAGTRIPTTGPGFGFEITDGIGLFGGASIVYAF